MRLVQLILTLAFLFSAPARTRGEESQQRPNIVFILADDLGWADLACDGSDLHETPNLDRLANQGVRFTDAYAASPVCTPTRVSILTGKHPARLHMTIWREAAFNRGNRKLLEPVCVDSLPTEETTVAELLKHAGYYNVHLGKWHVGRAEGYPQAHGFHRNIGGEGGVRVPLIVRGPDTAAGKECGTPVFSCDLFPTLLDAASVDANLAGPIDGLSLTPLLKNPTTTLGRDSLYFHYPHYYATTSPVSAIRKGDWKLLEYYEDGRLELYSLKEDLGESTNQAIARPDLASQLHSELRDWRTRVEALEPEPNPNK